VKKIEIKCGGQTTFKLSELTEFQGNLKSLSQVNYDKLKKEILKEGFTAPFFVWNGKAPGSKTKCNFILDGHQRFRTLSKMQSEGQPLQDYPVVMINAKNWHDARRILLGYVSQYGKLDPQGLYEFMSDSEIDWTDIKESFDFPDIDFDKFEAEYFDVPTDDAEPKEKKKTKCPECGHEFSLGSKV